MINSRDDKVCSRAAPSLYLCLFLYAVGIDEIKVNLGLFVCVSPRRNFLHNIYRWLEYQPTPQKTVCAHGSILGCSELALTSDQGPVGG